MCLVESKCLFEKFLKRLLFVHGFTITHLFENLRIVRIPFQTELGVSDGFGKGEMQIKISYGEM